MVTTLSPPPVSAENYQTGNLHRVPDSLVPTPLIRRAPPANALPTLPPEIEEQFNQLTRNVRLLSAHFLGDTTPPTENLKERSARRIKKFQRVGGDEPTGETPCENMDGASGDTDEAADRLALNKHIAWPRQTPAGEGMPPGRSARQWWQHQPSLGLLLGAQATGLLLLFIGYLIGHSNLPGKGYGRPAVDLFGQPELAEQAVQTANEAMHAEHSGDADAARKIYETALKKHVDLPGINYRLALLAIVRNDRLEAEQRLAHSTLDGENVAESCYVLARLAADKGDFEEASNQMQRATRARPLDGKYFFYWGELLRRMGKPQMAVAAFDKALDRPYTAESGDLYLFKQRLAKVEFGHDDAFNAELARHLSEAPVAGEWMILAAAQELDRRVYPAAAEHLRLAADRLPSSIYAVLTHDYFFQAQAKRSEVAPLLNHTPPTAISTAGPTVLDPGTWSPERGDPGTWATAGNPPAR